MFDLVIQNGEVIDGTGAARHTADVGLVGDRIAAIGQLAPAPRAATCDARGLIVAPGLIDVHNHSEGWLRKTVNLVSKTMQGFTTEVLMSDGISYAPVDRQNAREWIYYLRSLDGLCVSDYDGWESIADYLAALDRATAQNVLALIPFANVRALAVGWGRHPADDAQIRRMQYLVRQAMEEGAAGVSTGLDYIGQCFAGTEEISRAVQAAAPRNGLYVTHVRYKRGVVEGVREAIEIGRRAGVSVHISHLKGANPREAEEVLELLNGLPADCDLTFDVYPYLPGSTMLSMLLPYEVWEDGPLAVLGKLGQPRIRAQFNVQLTDFRSTLDQVRVGWLPGPDHQHLLGQTLAEVVRASQTPDDPGAALCDLLIDQNLAVLCVFHIGEDRLVDPFLSHPRFMLGSDGIFFPTGRVHPRQFGAGARLLGPLVRERRLFSLEHAVASATGRPAARFGLKDRGVLREGAFADILVFDPREIADQATYLEPRQPARGVRQVLVNGQYVVQDGEPVLDYPNRPPGRALRYQE